MIATAVRDRQHAADHDVAGAHLDLFGVPERPQPHLPVDRPLNPGLQ